MTDRNTTTTICTCGRPLPQTRPPEPPVGTWVRDRFGGLSKRHEGGRWAPPGFLPIANWQAMWEARGPLVECGSGEADDGR